MDSEFRQSLEDRANMAEQAAEELNKAIDFAIDGRDENNWPLSYGDRMEFLRMWREGDWKGIKESFPSFKSDMLNESSDSPTRES